MRTNNLVSKRKHRSKQTLFLFLEREKELSSASVRHFSRVVLQFDNHKMEKPAESKKPCFLLFLAVLVPLVFTLLILGFSPFLVTTITTLFLSTISIVRFSKKKVVIVKNPTQKEQEQVAEKASTLTEIENVAQSQESEEISHIHEYQVEATDFPSDSESSGDFSSTGNFELSWMCSSNVGQNLVISESSSVSDDDDDDFDDQDGDDLIEISLPMSNSLDFNAVSKKNSLSNLPDYLPEGLLELWAELNEANEEDNLIEIDLSMDSIKSSISEIEA